MKTTDSKFSDYVVDEAEPDGMRAVPAATDAPVTATTDRGAAPTEGPAVIDLSATTQTKTEPVHTQADPAAQRAPTAATVPAPTSADRTPRLTRASAAWAAITVALVLAVVLIVFVLANPTVVVIHFLGLSASLAIGMAMLIAAVTGGLLVATVGVARLTQLRIRARRTRGQAQS